MSPPVQPQYPIGSPEWLEEQRRKYGAGTEPEGPTLGSPEWLEAQRQRYGGAAPAPQAPQKPDTSRLIAGAMSGSFALPRGETGDYRDTERALGTAADVAKGTFWGGAAEVPINLPMAVLRGVQAFGDPETRVRSARLAQAEQRPPIMGEPTPQLAPEREQSIREGAAIEQALRQQAIEKLQATSQSLRERAPKTVAGQVGMMLGPLAHDVVAIASTPGLPINSARFPRMALTLRAITRSLPVTSIQSLANDPSAARGLAMLAEYSAQNPEVIDKLRAGPGRAPQLAAEAMERAAQIAPWLNKIADDPAKRMLADLVLDMALGSVFEAGGAGLRGTARGLATPLRRAGYVAERETAELLGREPGMVGRLFGREEDRPLVARLNAEQRRLAAGRGPTEQTQKLIYEQARAGNRTARAAIQQPRGLQPPGPHPLRGQRRTEAEMRHFVPGGEADTRAISAAMFDEPEPASPRVDLGSETGAIRWGTERDEVDAIRSGRRPAHMRLVFAGSGDEVPGDFNAIAPASGHVSVYLQRSDVADLYPRDANFHDVDLPDGTRWRTVGKAADAGMSSNPVDGAMDDLHLHAMDMRVPGRLWIQDSGLRKPDGSRILHYATDVPADKLSGRNIKHWPGADPPPDDLFPDHAGSWRALFSPDFGGYGARSHQWSGLNPYANEALRGIWGEGGLKLLGKTYRKMFPQAKTFTSSRATGAHSSQGSRASRMQDMRDVAGEPVYRKPRYPGDTAVRDERIGIWEDTLLGEERTQDLLDRLEPIVTRAQHLSAELDRLRDVARAKGLGARFNALRRGFEERFETMAGVPLGSFRHGGLPRRQYGAPFEAEGVLRLWGNLTREEFQARVDDISREIDEFNRAAGAMHESLAAQQWEARRGTTTRTLGTRQRQAQRWIRQHPTPDDLPEEMSQVRGWVRAWFRQLGAQEMDPRWERSDALRPIEDLLNDAETRMQYQLSEAHPEDREGVIADIATLMDDLRQHVAREMQRPGVAHQGGGLNDYDWWHDWQQRVYHTEGLWHTQRTERANADMLARRAQQTALRAQRGGWQSPDREAAERLAVNTFDGEEAITEEIDHLDAGLMVLRAIAPDEAAAHNDRIAGFLRDRLEQMRADHAPDDLRYQGWDYARYIEEDLSSPIWDRVAELLGPSQQQRAAWWDTDDLHMFLRGVILNADDPVSPQEAIAFVRSVTEAAQRYAAGGGDTDNIQRAFTRLWNVGREGLRRADIENPDSDDVFDWARVRRMVSSELGDLLADADLRAGSPPASQVRMRYEPDEDRGGGYLGGLYMGSYRAPWRVAQEWGDFTGMVSRFSNWYGEAPSDGRLSTLSARVVDEIEDIIGLHGPDAGRQALRELADHTQARLGSGDPVRYTELQNELFTRLREIRDRPATATDAEPHGRTMRYGRDTQLLENDTVLRRVRGRLETAAYGPPEARDATMREGAARFTNAFYASVIEPLVESIADGLPEADVRTLIDAMEREVGQVDFSGGLRPEDLLGQINDRMGQWVRDLGYTFPANTPSGDTITDEIIRLLGGFGERGAVSLGSRRGAVSIDGVTVMRQGETAEELGIRRGRPRGRPKGSVTPQSDARNERIAVALQNGQSVRDIARDEGVSMQSVYLRMRSMGLRGPGRRVEPARLAEWQAIEQEYRDGGTLMGIARRHNLDQSGVWQILRRRGWRSSGAGRDRMLPPVGRGERGAVPIGQRGAVDEIIENLESASWRENDPTVYASGRSVLHVDLKRRLQGKGDGPIIDGFRDRRTGELYTRDEAGALLDEEGAERILPRLTTEEVKFQRGEAVSASAHRVLTNAKPWDGERGAVDWTKWLRRNKGAKPSGDWTMGEGFRGVLGQSVLPSAVGAGAGGLTGAAIGEKEGGTPGMIGGALAGAALGAGIGFGAGRGLSALTSGKLPTPVASAAPGMPTTLRRRPRSHRIAGPGVPKKRSKVQYQTFDLEPALQKKLLAKAKELEVSGEVQPRRVSWAQQKATAQKLGMGDIERAWVNNDMDGTTLLAIRDLYSGNAELLEKLYKQLDDAQRGVTRDDPAALQAEIGAIEQENRQLLKMFIPKASDFGRNLNSLKILANRRLDPFTWVAKAQKLAGRELTPEEIATIHTHIGNGERTKLVRFVGDLQKPVGFFDRDFWTTLRRAGLLTGIKTQARNLLSNFGELGMRQLDQPVAAVYDALATALIRQVSKGKVGHRTIPFLSPLARMKASLVGAYRGLKEMRGVMKGQNPEYLARFDIPKETNYKQPLVDAYTKFILRAQGAADRPWRQAAFMESLREQAEVLTKGIKDPKQRAAAIDHMVKSPNAEMTAQAILDAEEGVFQNMTAPFAFLQGARHRLNQAEAQGVKWAGRAQFLFDFVVPFQKTPSAVLTRLVERTPIGMVESAVGLVKLLRAAKVPGMDERVLMAMQRRYAKDFGRSATGLLALMIGYKLAEAGRAAGRLPENGSERDKFFQQGKVEDGVYMQDRWWKLTGVSPLGNLVALGAQFYHDSQDPNATPVETVAAQGTGVLRTLMENSFMRGVDELIAGVKNEHGVNIGRFARNALGSWVPTVVADAARAWDPYVREQKNILDGVAARIPVVSFALPIRLDEFVMETKKQGIDRWTGAFDPFLSREPTTRRDPLKRQLAEVDARVPRRTKAKDETDEQYRQRMIQEGAEVREALQAMFASQAFQSLGDSAKKYAAQDVISDVRRTVTDAQRKGKRMPASWEATINRSIARERQRERTR